MSVSLIKTPRFVAHTEHRAGSGHVPQVVDTRTGDRYERHMLDKPSEIGFHSLVVAQKLAAFRTDLFNRGKAALRYTKIAGEALPIAA